MSSTFRPLTHLTNLLCLLLCLPLIALSQDFRATISGQVTDQNGAAVPNATVRAIRVDTNVATETRTNADGYYTLPYLNPGDYHIEVSAPGFNTLRRENITLRVADRLNLPLTLTVGALKQEVTVTAQQELIETATANRGLVFDPVKTQEYPLNGRQAYMLMQLTPGVIFTQEEFGATGFSGTRGWDVNGSYKINGGRSGTNQFLLNGAPISTTGTWQIAPNVEAIQEFKVMTNTYDAQYGRTGGGTVNTTLKSGTNEWHGSAFEFFRHEALDANTTQNNRVGASRGKHRTHQFGGVIGGPIRKDKDFILFSFEGFREVVPFPIVSSVPPLDLREGKNFTKYGIKIYDPLTTRLCRPGIDTPPGQPCFGTYIRDPFPNNEIPPDRLSPIGKAILNLYPAPNAPGLTQNFFATGNLGRYRYNQPMGRFDHIFNDRTRMYVVFAYQNGYEFRNNNGFPEPAIVANYNSNRRTHQYVFDVTHVLSSTKVLDVRLSFGRFAQRFPDGNLDSDFTVDKLGIRMPVVPTVKKQLPPRINLSSYNSIIGNTYSFSADTQIDFAPSMTHTIGRHTLHYGFEWARIARASMGPGRANGEFTFNNGFTQQYADRGQGAFDGSGIASLLLGYPASGFIDWNDSAYRINQYYAAYIQDDWQVRPDLTLNLGLRYDVQVPFVERFNRVIRGFDYNVKNPLSDQVLARWRELKAQYDATNPRYPYPDPPAELRGGILFADEKNRRTYDTEWWNIQPRLGFAWKFAERTVLRGGFGIYYRFASQGNLSTGFSQRTNYQAQSPVAGVPGVPSATGVTGPYSLQNPFPDGVISPKGRSLGLLTNIGQFVGYDGRTLKIPRSYIYSLGIERELPFEMVLEVSYSGNKTIHDVICCSGVYYDEPPPRLFASAQADPILFNRQLPNPFYGILPASSDLGRGQTLSAYNLYRPYPLFNGIIEYNVPGASFRYDAMQTKLEKRVLGGRRAGILTFVLSYTWSKHFEDNHRLNVWDNNEPLAHDLEYQDKTHSFAFSGVWDLPFGEGRALLSSPSRYLGWLVNGWQMNWILTYYSGYLVDKPNLLFNCGDYKANPQTPDRWFNNDKNCYQLLPPFARREALFRFSWIRQPSKPQLNVSLAKNIRLSERYGLQLRAESFNVTNTPILKGPDTNFFSPNFGRLFPDQKNFPRIIQLAAKFTF